MKLAWLGLAIPLFATQTWGETLEGNVVGITDGDTLTLLVDRTQHKIRLAQIDTPERGQPWAARRQCSPHGLPTDML